MDYKDLAKSALAFFVPVLKGKAMNKIGTDFSEAINNEILLLWDKIKPLFIQEIEEETTKFEQEPENSELQADIFAELKKLLKKDETLQLSISELSKKIENENPSYIKNNTITFSGSNNIGVVDSKNVVINTGKKSE